MRIGNREFQTKGHTYVMGILNVTPDSFSDGGKWNHRDKALRHVEEMLAEGADIIDIGGESTRPGYMFVPEEEEIARVVPVIEAVKAAFDVPVSLDTYKAQVAAAGIQAGADLINDVWGLKYEGWLGNGMDMLDDKADNGMDVPNDKAENGTGMSDNGRDVPGDRSDGGTEAGTDKEPEAQSYNGMVAKACKRMEAKADKEPKAQDGRTGVRKTSDMAKVIAASGLPCCLMHNRRDTDYRDFTHDVISDLGESLELAAQAGIPREKIILDPGIGFAKSYEQNLELIRRLEELTVLGCPLLLGCSRKSVIGLTLDLPADQRLEGTLVTTVAAVMKGAMFVRVHDIKENVRAVRMAEAIWKPGENAPR